MNAFEALEQRLWQDPESLTDEEIEQLVQLCTEKEQNDEDILTTLHQQWPRS